MEDFEVDSNTRLSLRSGSKLTVYVHELDISSNAITNPGVPTDLMIYSSAASSTNDDYKVDISSNSTITGTIYAPNAAINISSNSNSLGAIRGKYINTSSNAKFHYDEALEDWKDILLQVMKLFPGAKLIEVLTLVQACGLNQAWFNRGRLNQQEIQIVAQPSRLHKSRRMPNL